MVKNYENRATKIIEDILTIRFNDSFSLPGKWGIVDRYYKINYDTMIFLEIETKQKHPCTNVLKVWPYLEENPKNSCYLVQVYYENSPGRNSNRDRLGTWLANKMSKELGVRFKYYRVGIASDGSIIAGANELEYIKKEIECNG